jgi:ankyrin repeat protein
MPPPVRAVKAETSAIHGPAAKGDAIKVEAAIRSGVNINGADLGSFTALHWAAMKGHLTVASVLIANRAKLDPKDKRAKTPLDYALEQNHTGVADFLMNAKLLSEGKKVLAPNSKSKSPRSKSAQRVRAPPRLCTHLS